MRCLVIAALERRQEPLIISLEQSPEWRDLQGDAWRGTDGRSSEAMWNLTRFLLEQEKAGRLELHQQISFGIVMTKGSPPRLDSTAYERGLGTPLRALAARGQLIALSGNAHSRTTPLMPPPLAYDPAGSYAGPGILHVSLEPAAGGSAWNCTAGGCGEHELPPGTPFAGPPDTMMDGKPYGHDFVYRLPRVSASPPKLPPKTMPSGER